MSETIRSVYGKVRVIRQNGFQRAARQGAMSNLAAARRAKAADFANRVMREVVMEQEAAFDFALLQIVHELLVFFRAQGRGDNGLSFTARKQRRAVNPRQPADLARNGPNLRETPAIGTSTLVQDIVAEDGFFQVIEDDLRRPTLLRLILGIGFDDFLLERVDRGITVAFFLLGRVERRAQSIGILSLDLAASISSLRTGATTSRF